MSQQPPAGQSAPTCACLCGRPVNWQPHLKRWARFCKGHARSRRHTTDQKPCECGCGAMTQWNSHDACWARFLPGHYQGVVPRRSKEVPILCACGCGNPVRWQDGKGWAIFVQGHQRRGVSVSAETKERMSLAHKERQLRLRPWIDGQPIAVQNPYVSREYRQARKRLVAGKPCLRCGTLRDICAHHMREGDHESLVPLCRACHTKVHASGGHVEHLPRELHPEQPLLGVPDSPLGYAPPAGEEAPYCRCGCGQRVAWKRARGWAKCVHGHATAKVAPAGTSRGTPLKCKCGCGADTLWKDGRGWAEYRRAHRQRVEGAFNKNSVANLPQRAQLPNLGPVPGCACGCGGLVAKAARGHKWNTYIHGHAATGSTFTPEHRAKLSAAKLVAKPEEVARVHAIRRMAKMGVLRQYIADGFDMHVSSVNAIVQGRAFAHVPPEVPSSSLVLQPAPAAQDSNSAQTAHDAPGSTQSAEPSATWVDAAIPQPEGAWPVTPTTN